VRAAAVPLATADLVMPGLGLTGTLDADARLRGPSAAPTGDWRLKIARLSAPQTRSAGLPPLDIAGSGRLADGRTQLDLTASAGRGGSLRASGSAPLGQGPVDLTVRGTVDLGIANASVAAAGRHVAGKASVDLRVRGTLATPVVEGGATIAGASVSDASTGFKLTGIAGRIAARGTEITIERLTAATPGGGRLAASGSVAVDPGAGFPGTIHVTSSHARLVDNALAQATADLDLTLSGPLARDPRIAGRVHLDRLDVTVPERLPATLRPLDGTRHIRPPPQAAKRLALARRARARGRRAPPFNATLDITLSAPNRIFVRGRGIDAELGGDLRITGTAAAPVPVGAFELRRGRFALAGTRLDFTRGRLSFTGELTPDLDFLAQTQAADVTAYIAVTGPASEPSFTFSSSPDLPQDEVLSRLLFAKASGGLSPFQALQLAQVAAQFSGGGGNDVFDSLRRSLGVDSLDITTGASGSPAVGLSRAISDRVSVGVKAGTQPEDSAVSVDVDLTRRLRLQGEVTSRGSTAVGIGAEIEY
jgi:translocation and assembly module TamB